MQLPTATKTILLRHYKSFQRAVVCNLSTAVNKYTTRTHNCGQLNKQHTGQRVKLSGWIQYTRFNNKIVALRDSYGTTQCILDKSLIEERANRKLYNESIVTVSGIVRERPLGQNNPKLQTGEIEISVDQIEIVNEALRNLPILTRDHVETTEESRLKFRYLELRTKEMQDALRFRSRICNLFRTKLIDLGFVECETPTLSNRTPGGANEFIVPTTYPNRFYSLTQSPQQLKQLLMIGGVDRYFQIARCYRDEATRPDRQPEFTQVDIELSFTTQDLVMNLIDDLMNCLWLELTKSQIVIPRMTYDDAIRLYGTDKPDTRFGSEIYTDTKNLRLAINFPCHITNDIIDEIAKKAQDSLKLNLPYYKDHQANSTIIYGTSNEPDSRKYLGLIRKLMAKKLESLGVEIYKKKLSPLWIYDFPLFTTDNDGKRKTNHHPFTAPTSKTLQLLDQDPLKVRGQHYDLVLNGQEIAGGSIRIHESTLQKQIFRLLDVDGNSFEYFLDALDAGCPPHGGIAFGLDRLVATLLSKESIKDVVAFPKSSSGRDVMTNCPEEISESVKKSYNIKSIDLTND